MKYKPSWSFSQAPPILLRCPSEVSTSANCESFQQKTFITDNLQKFSPTQITSLNFRDQSLIIILTLADSFLNWNLSGLSIKPSVQQMTYELFKTYQSIIWKSENKNDLYSKDVDSNKTSCDGINKIENSVKSLDFPVELMKILLKKFSSTISIFHMITAISQYYSNNTKVKNLSDCSSLLRKNLLKRLVCLIEYGLQKSIRKPLWDSPKIDGLLCFKKLHQLSSKNSLQSMSSKSPLLFNYDNETISISPDASRHWQVMYLEPFGGQRNIAYIVALPESDFIVDSAKKFFKELSSVYEVSISTQF